MAGDKAKTITTFLVNGSPNGLREVFMQNISCRAVVVPKSGLKEANKRENSSCPALYFLINKDNEKVYIGESERWIDRLNQHKSNSDSGKDFFWHIAVVFISSNNDISKADIKYLEYLSLNAAKAAGKADVSENKQDPSRPHLPEHQAASVDEFFDHVKLLAGFVGYDFLIVPERKSGTEMFYCKRGDTDSKGYYQDGKFVVLKGSKVSASIKGSYRPSDNVLKIRVESIGDDNKLTKDLTFDTPSAASCFCSGISSNGWKDWRNAKNVTLHDAIGRAVDSGKGDKKNADEEGQQ